MDYQIIFFFIEALILFNSNIKNVFQDGGIYNIKI